MSYDLLGAGLRPQPAAVGVRARHLPRRTMRRTLRTAPFDQPGDSRARGIVSGRMAAHRVDYPPMWRRSACVLFRLLRGERSISWAEPSRVASSTSSTTSTQLSSAALARSIAILYSAIKKRSGRVPLEPISGVGIYARHPAARASDQARPGAARGAAWQEDLCGGLRQSRRSR